ncbi:hypothetical protein UVI_02044940 [Ustilaginoidea virens]|nr:hypothetical protein UVI_02044940 [Ustilaginoidea virens]
MPAAGTAVSPPPSSAAAQIGRPSMWTKSAQRKMTRLYVYTTLPLSKIVELIHSHSPEGAPGHDSAHKKLNILLDKEPRWLHPRNDSDMSRRVAELANSPTRLSSAAAEAAAEAALDGQPSSASSHARTCRSPGLVWFQDGVSPASASLPQQLPALHRSAVAFSSPPPPSGSPTLTLQNPSLASTAGSPLSHDQAECPGEPKLFSNFLRRTTCLSNSTNNTTGSFRRVLSDYSEPYVQTVKRLVKRFTAPLSAAQSSVSPSPSLETAAVAQTWVDEDDCPPKLQHRPFPIPGDALKLDECAYGEHCQATRESHTRQRCLCFDADLDACVLPWVNRTGLTRTGQRLVTSGPTRHDLDVVDPFGNTVLHFLAARGSLDVLKQALKTDYCLTLIGARNSAGQNFLHVLDRRILENSDHVASLLATVPESASDLIHSRDDYGRSFVHILQAEQPPGGELVRRVAGLCHRPGFSVARDAFGFTATSGSDPTSTEGGQPRLALQQSLGPISATGPGLAGESRLLRHIRLAEQNPLLQDEHGRNGLHCLAMATLSSAAAAHKYQRPSPARDKITKRQRNPGAALDSSRNRLALRLGLLQGLLEAGVDPNQHDEDGNTPLMVFVANLPEDDDYKMPPKILEALVQGGANVGARNRRGETALHIAVRCGRKLAMRTLCRHGANVHARDSAGRSLLDVADAKMLGCERGGDTKRYAHFEACRAWLSGRGMALQRPSVTDEWGRR